jgi:large subunit ribosomal protein L37Ae
MAEDKGLGSVKRFGTRYGRTVKFKLAAIESVQKKPQKCPYCLKLSARRLSTGVFECEKCASKFTSKAFAVEEIKFEEPVVEEVVEEVENG